MRHKKSSNSDNWKKALKAYQQGKLFHAIYLRLKCFLRGFRYLAHNPVSGKVSLHCPEYITPDRDELEIVERIFRSFKKMKQDQQKTSTDYLPSSIWQTQLDRAYSYLIAGLKENDINKFHYFLANFGAWKEYHGVESATFIRENMNSFIKRRYLQNDVFYKQLKIWKWFYNDRKQVSCLGYPMYGNQAGAYIDGVFVGLGSFFNEIYGALLSGLICNVKHPVVAELGAGYGKLAYFTLRDIDDFTFIDFDLPETLCLAAYYLMKVYPDKQILLYGEEDYSPDAHKKYDLIFMPSYEIFKMGESTVDLFINKNSLGEMTKEAVYNYIAYISKATKGYFFHMNHEISPNIYSNNERGLLGYEYPVPKDNFTLLFRYPDIGHMLSRGFLDFGMDIFVYLYERKSHLAPNTEKGKVP